MRVLIIGGTNFIGPHVVRRLVEESCEVTLFHRGQTTADLPPVVSHVYGERQTLRRHRGEFKKLLPHVVLDMFPYVEYDALNLVQTFRGLAERVVAIGSMDVYRAYGLFRRLEDGPPDLTPFNEEAPLRGRLYPYRMVAPEQNELFYNYEKILVERIVMGETDLPGTVLRLPLVYGPGDRQHRLFEYLKRMDDGRPCILLEEEKAKWRWTRGYVENVAEAIALAVINRKTTNRIYNVGEEHALTELEWVRRIGEAAGWKGKVKLVQQARLPAHLAEPYDWQHHLAADTNRIREEMAYAERINAAEALRRTIAWARANPPQEIDHERFNYSAEDAARAKMAERKAHGA